MHSNLSALCVLCGEKGLKSFSLSPRLSASVPKAFHGAGSGEISFSVFSFENSPLNDKIINRIEMAEATTNHKKVPNGMGVFFGLRTIEEDAD